MKYKLTVFALVNVIVSIISLWMLLDNLPFPFVIMAPLVPVVFTFVSTIWFYETIKKSAIKEMTLNDVEKVHARNLKFLKEIQNEDSDKQQ